MIDRVRRGLAHRLAPPPQDEIALLIQAYEQSGRVPYSPGYSFFRDRFVSATLASTELLQCFAANARLPDKFGFGLDERVVEYPWIFSRLEPGTTQLLDAGGALSFPYLLEMPLLTQKKIVVYTLAPDAWIHSTPNISYVYGDLRETILKDALCDEIVCLSTLDHIGMDNTQRYSSDARFRENKPNEFKRALVELRRLLKPNGHFLFTVPFGRYENLGWMQQFDSNLLQQAIETFGGTVLSETFYRYSETGWQIARADECAECAYFDILRAPTLDSDRAAAARAVACVELYA